MLQKHGTHTKTGTETNINSSCTLTNNAGAKTQVTQLLIDSPSIKVIYDYKTLKLKERKSVSWIRK